MSLKTAFQAALARSEQTHPIPPITDPMGRHWDQPSRFEIEVDATHAMMSEEAFNELAEYSTSIPTGVYPGKMWKRRNFKVRFVEGPDDTWSLCWFGHDPEPGYCSNHSRRILIV